TAMIYNQDAGTNLAIDNTGHIVPFEAKDIYQEHAAKLAMKHFSLQYDQYCIDNEIEVQGRY
ncbi:hypothetical protein EVG20_g10759, partial [Dentipellis fragilis]